MSSTSLLLTIAGLSMSFAGFASLFLALRPHDAAMRRHEVGQVNAIVPFALTSMFGALFVFPLAAVTGDATALRLISAIVLASAFYHHQVRVGTAWLRWTRVQNDLPRAEFWVWIAPFAIAAIADQVLLVVTLFNPRQETFELALLAMLLTPALVFVRVVTQMGATVTA